MPAKQPSGQRRVSRASLGLLTLFMALTLSGCASVNSMMGGNSVKEARAQVAWAYQRDAILLELMADERLNERGEQAHTLLLAVYQAADANAFNKLLAEKPALTKSLETGQGGPTILDLKRFVVEPGARTVLAIDRAQNAQHVGIVAGYYSMNPTAVARSFAIPVEVITEGALVRHYKAVPATLAVRLHLGAERIVNAESLNRQTDEQIAAGAAPKHPEGDGQVDLRELAEAANSTRGVLKLESK